MDASFILDDTESPVKPLPYTLGKRSKGERITQPDTYSKFETEFYDVVKDCAKYIDKLNSIEDKIKYSRKLNKIFVLKEKMLLMRLFRELATK